MVKRSLRLWRSSEKGLSRPKGSARAKVASWSSPACLSNGPAPAQMQWWNQRGSSWASSQLHTPQQEI